MVLPTDAFLHEGPGGVDDEDDHGSDVAAELEDDEHPATEGLAGYETCGPFLNLGYKGAWQGHMSQYVRYEAIWFDVYLKMMWNLLDPS